MFFSNVSSWVGIPFVRLVDFLENIADRPNFDTQIQEMAKEEFEVADLTKIDNFRIKNKVAAFMAAKALELQRTHQLEVLARIDEIFSKKFLRYGKILKINKDKLKDLENSFILPVFIKPGRTHFMLRTP